MTKNLLHATLKQSKQWHKALVKKVLSSPKSNEAYDRTLQEIKIALMMRETREKLKMSQEDVAQKMETTRSVVSRLESCGTGQRHSPSLQTFLKYAHALGCDVRIDLVPPKSGHRKLARQGNVATNPAGHHKL